MKCHFKMLMALLLVLALMVSLSLSCGGGGGGKVTITIGELTDLTGPASPAVATIHYALEDMVRYYNDEGLIPGVKLNVATWDTQYDPSRDVPGYDWVREKGARLIVAVTPQDALILKPFAERDKVAVAALGTDPGLLEPPGWVFCMSNSQGMEAKTLLKWIADQVWNYGQGAVPKVGLVAWNDATSKDLEEAIKGYCQAHSDKFQYAGGILAPMGTMMWGGQVDALKGCDYIFAFGQGGCSFIQEFRGRGYHATFIDAGTFSMMESYVVNTLGWQGLDGIFSANSTPGWNDNTTIVNLAKELLSKYRPGQAKDIVDAGFAYVGGVHNLVATFQILQQAMEKVGAKNFNGQAYYDAAVKFETGGPLYEGYPQWGFSATKRYLVDDSVIFKFSAEEKELVKITDWLPLVTD
jgi:ABC-type branched-subunit amino acid transport system substrate-binding protein